MYQGRRHKTDIEQIVSEVLPKLNLFYRREYKLDYYHVDFFIPSLKLSIQCDGSYWHGGCEKCNSKKVLTGKQKLQKRRDKACAAFHKHQKLSLLRLCECTIKNEELLIQTIKKAIKEIEDGKRILIF